jgi:hypothetical protein
MASTTRGSRMTVDLPIENHRRLKAAMRALMLCAKH